VTPNEISARRAAIRGELHGINNQHSDGEMPADVQQRCTDLEAEAERLNAAERRQATLDELDRHAVGARPVTGEAEGAAAEAGETVFGLTPEQRMADYIRARTGATSGSLSPGRAVRGMLTGRWDGAEAERRAMSTTVGTAGGFLVPEALSANVIDLARNASVLVQAGALTIPMPNQTLRVVQVLTDPTASFRGEGTAITESEGTFGALNLTAHSLAAMVRVNNELLDDAPSFAATLDHQLAATLALKLDWAGLYGSDAGNEPQGLRTATNVSQLSMGANGAAMDDYDDVLDLMQAIEEANGTPTTAVMAPRTRNKLAKLVSGISGDKTARVRPGRAMPQYDVLPPSLAPRGLCREVAAVYIGVSPGTFDQMVTDGRMPGPKRIGTRKIWDRLKVDLAFAALADDEQPNPWDTVP
jgi:HK97 family phage major capsid protein